MQHSDAYAHRLLDRFDAYTWKKNPSFREHFYSALRKAHAVRTTPSLSEASSLADALHTFAGLSDDAAGLVRTAEIMDEQVDAWNRAATRRTWYGRLKSVDVREFEYAVMDLATVTLRPLRRCARSARIEYAREYHPELLTE